MKNILRRHRMDKIEKDKLIETIKEIYPNFVFKIEEFKALKNETEKHKFEIVADGLVEKLNLVLGLLVREFINREILDPKVGYNQTDGTRALHKYQINSMIKFNPIEPPDYIDNFLTKYSLIIIYLFFSKFE